METRYYRERWLTKVTLIIYINENAELNNIMEWNGAFFWATHKRNLLCHRENVLESLQSWRWKRNYPKVLYFRVQPLGVYAMQFWFIIFIWLQINIGPDSEKLRKLHVWINVG